MVQAHSSQAVDVMMDAGWQDFLRQKVNTFIKWDLVRFFHDNPQTTTTADAIAQIIGREAQTVQRALDALVLSQLVISEKTNGQTIYRLSSDEDARHRVRDFVSACHNRAFREKAIQYVMGFALNG